MTNDPPNDRTCQNTDREIWREREGDYYADSIFVTKQGLIGINCGGYVSAMPIRAWHKLANPSPDRDGLIEKLKRRADLAEREAELHKDEFQHGLKAGLREAIYEMQSIEATRVPDKSVSFEQPGSVSAQASRDRNHAPVDLPSEIPVINQDIPKLSNSTGLESGSEQPVGLRTNTLKPVTDAELNIFKKRLMTTLLDDDREDAVFISRILTRLRLAEERLPKRELSEQKRLCSSFAGQPHFFIGVDATGHIHVESHNVSNNRIEQIIKHIGEHGLENEN